MLVTFWLRAASKWRKEPGGSSRPTLLIRRKRGPCLLLFPYSPRFECLYVCHWVRVLFVQIRPADEEEEDEPPPPPPTQKQTPRVQVSVIQPQTQPLQQQQPTALAQPQAQQVSPRPSGQPATQSVTLEGEARVRYSFKAETQRELPCSKVEGHICVVCYEVSKKVKELSYWVWLNLLSIIHFFSR